jgi:PAS domain S-box-containing protein
MEKILIIDDSPIDARIAAKMLTGAGYSTTIIHDGREALGTARQVRPDLILLDVTMPKMDGYQVCQQLKADPETRPIPVTLYTIRDELIDCLKGIEAGADDFILKTSNGEGFLDRVRKILLEQQGGPRGPVESLDLNLIRPLAELQDREELVRLLYNTFNEHVHKAISVMIGAHVARVLIVRAIEKVTLRFPFFRWWNQAEGLGASLDWQMEEISTVDLIEGFQTFNNYLYQLINKLTRTRVNGVKEARVVSKAFTDMIRELHARYDELKTQTSPPVSPTKPTPEAARTDRPLNLDCTLDVSGSLIHGSDDLVQGLGYSKPELLGQPFSRVLTEESGRAWNRALAQLVEQGAAQAEFQLKAKNGHLLHTEARLTALYDSQGHFTMIRCRLEVISTSRLLQGYKDENEKLRRALHNLNEEFSTLASTISHDFRQPLHAILMLCQFLEVEYMSQLDEQAQGYFQSIQQAGVRMKALIEDVVHYARITSNNSVYEAVNLNQLVEEVREDLSATLGGRGATLQVLDALPTATCDRERFKELLTELVANGIKFNDKTPPLVEVGLLKDDAEGYTFYVKDNGIGIEEPYHESIFRLFHRLHKPEEYDGTGAGLAICRRIIESHGGRLWVRSQLGAGATFFFTLPREIASPAPPPSVFPFDLPVVSSPRVSLPTM